jgi:molybdate/tungstate transport system substrate-binding protein
MVMQLAREFYHTEELTVKLSSKDIKYIRPKEVDLLAMLEVHETDYIFIYKSVAIQHGLKYLVLPDEINLRNTDLDKHYSQASVQIRGNAPGTNVDVRGKAITYAITMLDDAPNPEAAGAFLHFLLNVEKGIKILNECGHNSLIPVKKSKEMILPHYLKKYTIEVTDSL